MLSRFNCGDTFSQSFSPSAYPASAGWTLKLRMVPQNSGDAIQITCTASGDSHVATAAATVTTGWISGAYSYLLWAENADTRVATVEGGTLTLVQDPRTGSAPLDLSTDAERALAAAKAAFAAYSANPTRQAYSIGGRSMTFNKATDIVPIIDYWQREVNRERRAAQQALGMADRRKIMVRTRNA